MASTARLGFARHSAWCRPTRPGRARQTRPRRAKWQSRHASLPPRVRGVGARAVPQHLKPTRVVAAVVRPHRQFGMPLKIDGRTPGLHWILVRAAPYRAVELHQVAPRLAVLGERQRVEPEVFDADMTVLPQRLDRAQRRVAAGGVARLLVRRRHQLSDAIVAFVHLGDPPLARLDVAFEVLPLDRSTEQLWRILETDRLPDDAGALVHQVEFDLARLQRQQCHPAEDRSGKTGHADAADHPTGDDCGPTQDDALRRQIHDSAEFCVFRRVNQRPRRPWRYLADRVHCSSAPKSRWSGTSPQVGSSWWTIGNGASLALAHAPRKQKASASHANRIIQRSPLLSERPTGPLPRQGWSSPGRPPAM